MSGTWADHIARVNGYIDADKAAKAARRTNAQAARAAAMPSPGAMPSMPDMPSAPMASGGANDAMGMQAGAASQGGWGGSFPNAQTIASAMDINPTAARLGITALGLLNPALGVGIGAINGIGNIANTANNVGMLNGLGVNPGFGSTVGGLLGFNGLAGTPTSALNAAMANQYSGFANLSTPQFAGDLKNGIDDQAGGFGSFGGWGEIAAAMDAANAAAMAGGTASNPAGGVAQGEDGPMTNSDISSEQLFQKGGYTGAGEDGIVQPWKRAGIVHEGEYVIPAHVVRKMMGRGMLG